MKRLLLFASLASVLLLVGATIWLRQQKVSLEKSPIQPNNPGVSIIFEVLPGMTLKSTLQQLEQQGVVAEAQKLYWLARWQKVSLKSGEYLIRGDMLPEELFSVLSSGKSIGYSLTVPEGYNLFEIGPLFEQKGLIKDQKEWWALVSNKDFMRSLLGEVYINLEGYLFPNTYQYTKKTTARELVETMVRTFLSHWEKLQPLAKAKGLSRHQLVTFASLVEKETGAPWERPKIAGVFWNRIERGMKLQTDPTIIYAKALLSGVYEINIRRVDLSLEHPYNTYYRMGLPPGPIANPGWAAMEAVVKPETTRALYFVSQNDGTHVFSETYEQHLQAVKTYQLDKKAREGKSWRDLGK